MVGGRALRCTGDGQRSTTSTRSRRTESNRARSRTERLLHLGATTARLVESPGTAPGEPACKAGARPSAQPLLRLRPQRPTRSEPSVPPGSPLAPLAPSTAAGRRGIEPRPADLESARPPWPPTYGAAYEDRTRLTRSTIELRHQSHHAAFIVSLARIELALAGLGDLRPTIGRDLGDARVTIPSRTRSRRAGFTCSLASQSGTRESNSASSAPKAGGAPCTMSQVVPRARVERASLRLQRSAVTGSAVEGLRHPVSVTIRPGRSENPATSQKSNGASEPASRFELDLRRYECRVFPERAGDLAARAGFEPAVRRLTATCVSASPPGNASRRARRVAHRARRRHVLSSCQRSWRSDERAHQGLRPEWFRRESNSIRPLKRRLLCLLSYETVSWTHVGRARVELTPFALKGRCTPPCYRPELWIDHCRCFIRTHLTD